MILAARYTVKGVKKAHKSYKKRQAEKEEKLLTERGQLPDIQDPSRELDTTCLVVAEPSKSEVALSTSSRKSTDSTESAEKALENDPSFQEYMQQQKALYLMQHKNTTHPPSYRSIMQQEPHRHLSKHSSNTTSSNSSGGHCNCHECMRMMTPVSPAPTTPLPALAELPSAHVIEHDTKIVELESSHTQPVEIMTQEDDMIFELPGNMPAMLPSIRQGPVVELPAQPNT